MVLYKKKSVVLPEHQRQINTAYGRVISFQFIQYQRNVSSNELKYLKFEQVNEQAQKL